MNNSLMPIFLLLLIIFLPLSLYGQDHKGRKPSSTKDAGEVQAPVYPSMAEPGKRVAIGPGRYMIYGFDKQPKMGTVIMKVQIYTLDGKKDTSMEVVADSGMPSMRGAHETGERPFSLSKKGDFLLPINIVMPGDWEIRLSIKKDGKVIFRGRYNFDV